MTEYLLIAIAIITACLLSACSPLQPDYTPDVTALSASWGTAPVLDARGGIIARGAATPARHPTIFHD